MAEVLRVSPTHLDQYIAAARDISILAVGNPAPDPARADYRSDQANKTRHVDGLPLGTRDGFVVEHDFPADGDYALNLTISSIPGSELRGYPYGWLEYAHEVVITLDGVSVFEGSIGGTEDSLALDQRQIQGVDEIRNRFRNIRVPVTAGPHEVAAAFVARSFAEGDYLLESQLPGEGVPDVPRLYGMEIIGPFNPTGISGNHAQPGADFPLYAANRERRAALRREDLRESRAPGVPSSCRRGGSRAAAGFLLGGTRSRRRFRLRYSERSDGDPREHEISLSCGPGRGCSRSGNERGATDQRSRARVAVVVLSLEPGPRRRAHRSSPKTGGSATKRHSSGKCAGCLRTRDRCRSSRTSPFSGSTSGG